VRAQDLRKLAANITALEDELKTFVMGEGMRDVGAALLEYNNWKAVYERESEIQTLLTHLESLEQGEELGRAADLEQQRAKRAAAAKIQESDALRAEVEREAAVAGPGALGEKQRALKKERHALQAVQRQHAQATHELETKEAEVRRAGERCSHLSCSALRPARADRVAARAVGTAEPARGRGAK